MRAIKMNDIPFDLNEELNRVVFQLSNSARAEELCKYTDKDNLVDVLKKFIYSCDKDRAERYSRLICGSFDSISVNFLIRKYNEAVANGNAFSTKLYKNRLEKYIQARDLNGRTLKDTELMNKLPCTKSSTVGHGLNHRPNDTSHGNKNQIKDSEDQVINLTDELHFYKSNDFNLNDEFGYKQPYDKNYQKQIYWRNASKVFEETIKQSGNSQNKNNCNHGKKPFWANASKLFRETLDEPQPTGFYGGNSLSATEKSRVMPSKCNSIPDNSMLKKPLWQNARALFRKTSAISPPNTNTYDSVKYRLEASNLQHQNYCNASEPHSELKRPLWQNARALLHKTSVIPLSNTNTDDSVKYRVKASNLQHRSHCNPSKATSTLCLSNTLQTNKRIHTKQINGNASDAFYIKSNEMASDSVHQLKENIIKNVELECETYVNITQVRSSERLKNKKSTMYENSLAPFNIEGKQVTSNKIPKNSIKTLKCMTPLNSYSFRKRKRCSYESESCSSIRPKVKRVKKVSTILIKRRIKRRNNVTSNSSSANTTVKSCDTNISTPTSTYANRRGKVTIIYRRNLFPSSKHGKLT